MLNEQRTDDNPPETAVPVRLSQAQKWDLARMAAAAVLSTCFFAAPLLLSQEQEQSALKRDTQLPALDQVAVVSTDLTVPTSTPPLQAHTVRARVVRPRAAARMRPIMVATPAVVVAADQPAFSRKLARFVAGDGRYSVRPFPTVDTEQR